MTQENFFLCCNWRCVFKKVEKSGTFSSERKPLLNDRSVKWCKRAHWRTGDHSAARGAQYQFSAARTHRRARGTVVMLGSEDHGETCKRNATGKYPVRSICFHGDPQFGCKRAGVRLYKFGCGSCWSHLSGYTSVMLCLKYRLTKLSRKNSLAVQKRKMGNMYNRDVGEGNYFGWKRKLIQYARTPSCVIKHCCCGSCGLSCLLGCQIWNTPLAS